MQKQTATNKNRITKWVVRIFVFILVLLGLLIGAVLNPGLFYKHKTMAGRFTVYTSDTLASAFSVRLQDAVRLIEKSEVYNPNFQMDVCLGESAYPNIIKRFFGDAFAWGFYNKVVIRGNMDSQKNLHGSGWNLSQLLAHEMTHCLQFDRFGLFRSNPLAGYPEWKWEGYAEYVSRKEVEEPLQQSIERLQKEQEKSMGWLILPDSTRTNLWYYKNWLLVKYCLDKKKMTYVQLLNDTTNGESLQTEMMQWQRKRD